MGPAVRNGPLQDFRYGHTCGTRRRHVRGTVSALDRRGLCRLSHSGPMDTLRASHTASSPPHLWLDSNVAVMPQ